MTYFKVTSSTETKALAACLAAIIQPGMVIALHGPLGSGKTTFTQGFGKSLGIKRAIKSPTYTIVKEYPIDEERLNLIHIDAYRLEDGGSDSIDLPSYLREDNIVLIEWPQYVADYFPDDYLKLTFKPMDDASHRLIEVDFHEQEKDTYLELVKEWKTNWERIKLNDSRA